MTNLQKRVLAAFIYFPALLLSAHDAQLFSIAMSFCLAVAWYEYLSFRSFPHDVGDWVKYFSKILLGILPTLLVALGYSMSLGLAAVAFVFQIMVIMSFTKKETLKAMREDLSFDVLGLLYLTGLYTLLVASQMQQGSGPEAIWFLFLIVGATDTGAYFVGKSFGKSPFFQSISPSKTLEGFMGGVASGLVAAALFWIVFSHQDYVIPNLWRCLIL